MREIEFRAWLKHRRIKKICKVVQIDFDVKRILLLDIERNIQLGWYDFDEIELIQYVGLKDKNGVKIFEKDIVKDEHKRLFVIEYKFGGFNIVPINYYNDEFSWNPLGDMQTAGWLNESAEIIGNIYANKELIEHD